MMYGALQSDSVYSPYTPDNVPKLIGFGEFKHEPCTWFYVCEFHDTIPKVPEVSKLVNMVAKIH